MERQLPAWSADGVIAVGMFVLSLSTLRDLGNYGLLDLFSRSTDAFGILLIAIQTLPLVLRRRFPVTVLLVVLVGFMIDRGLDYPSTLAGLGTLVALHAVGSQLSARRSAIMGLWIIGGLAAFTILGSILYKSVSVGNAVTILLTGIVALHLGREVHQGKIRSQALEQRARLAEDEREERARAAVADERGRIARELHDVVAHQLALMTVQADGAARVVTDGDPRVKRALATISEAGREGLQEMRRMVGLLRGPAERDLLEPQPGLAELPALAEHFATSGLPVTVRVLGEPRHLAGGLELSAYRIVQESLTNTMKHGGPGASAEVTVEYRPHTLDLTIVDNGRGLVGPTNGGHGLVGMRERAALLAGEFKAGPRPGGGYRVHASIPSAQSRTATA